MAGTDVRRWVEIWKQAGAELEADSVQSLAALAPLFNHATRTMPLRSSSGPCLA